MLNRTDRSHVKNENFNFLFCILKNWYTQMHKCTAILHVTIWRKQTWKGGEVGGKGGNKSTSKLDKDVKSGANTI